MSPKAMLLLTAVALTFLSFLGVFLYGLVAGIRVALRFLMPLVLLLLLVVLLSSLLEKPKARSG